MAYIVCAEKRAEIGKNASRKIRKRGYLPAILYGESIENVPLSLKKKDVIDIMKSETKENTLFKVKFDGETKDAMIKELQVDPASDEMLHADIILIAMDKIVRISVPVVLQGDAVGVKTEGGFVDFMTRELEIECLPKDIPENIPVEISHLHLHQSVKVENITPPEGIKFISDPGAVIVLIELPHKEEVAVAAEEAEEVIVEAEKEPEVIKKERAEKEEKE